MCVDDSSGPARALRRPRDLLLRVLVLVASLRVAKLPEELLGRGT